MEYVRLKDIGRIITGNTPPTSKPEYYGDYMPFIKATDISLGAKCTLVTEQMYSELAAEKYKESLVPKGSTCVVTIGSIGKKMTYAHTNLFVNQAINAIIPKNSYDKEYVYYTIRYSVLPQLKKLDSGTTSGRENVSKSSFSGIRIPVIKDKSVQHRIASILSAYDSLIENNTKRIRLLEKMAENLYKEWFVRFRFPGYEKTEMENGLPKGWKVERYGEVAAIYAGGDKPKVYSKEINTECNIPIYSNGVENNGLYGFTNKATVKVSSITISARGTVGFVAIRRIPFVPIVRLLTVVPQKGLDVYYLYFASRNNDLEGNGTSQQQLTVPMLKKRKVVIPIKELLREFGNRCSLFYNQIDNLQHQNTLLAHRRDLLLPRLMSGKLEVKP